MPFLSLPRFRRGPAPLALLAVAAVVLVGGLVYQTLMAEHSRRRAAERAVHDHASFAGWQLSEQASRDLLGAMVATFLPAQAHVDPMRPGDWPTAADLRSLIQKWPGERPPFLAGARFFFRLDWRDSSFEVAALGGEPDAAARRWARDTALAYPRLFAAPAALRPLMWGSPERGDSSGKERLRAVFSNDQYVAAFGGPAGAAPRVVVYGVSRDYAGRPLVTYGFETDAAAFAVPLLDDLLRRRTLLPPTAAHGFVDNQALAVQAGLPAAGGAAGRALYASSGPTPAKWDVVLPLDARFGGLVLRLAVRPEARAALGGRPGSPARLLALGALVLLTLALAAAAARQLRRQEELARLRSDFVGGVSHELRTPLAQIRMFAELLRNDQLRGDGERARGAEIIVEESQRLQYLVENVLSFSRAEHGSARVIPEPTALAPAVEKAVAAFAPLARVRRAAVRAHVAPQLGAMADPAALRQVLLNLLDNAVKYGPPGQTVVVAAAAAGEGRVRIWVDDRGPGIPAAERERVWQPYHRLTREAEASTGGSGIGLAVVRELVELHGGRCWVEDAPGGTGARVIAELPAAEVPADAEQKMWWYTPVEGTVK